MGKVTYQRCLATRVTILHFTMMKLAPGDLCSVILTQGPSWWHMHFSVNMDPARRILGTGRTYGLRSLLDLSQIFLHGGVLLILCLLLGPPVAKIVM